MTRINGHGPARDEDFLPPHLPYVLLCHTSDARCGRTFTVNRMGQWRKALTDRRAHENLCTTTSAQLILPGDPVR